MAIDVDWVTGKITIPRADMPIVQVSPELRSLDVAQFKLDLGTLHASVQGSPYPQLFTHNPEATAGGFTYARVINIIAPYFVEFEDGQYGVLTGGANHNLMDITVQNQVRLATQNSGGLIREPVNTEMAADIKQALRVMENRLEIDLTAQELILYADDGVTPLRRWPLETDGGENLVTSAGVQTKRRASII